MSFLANIGYVNTCTGPRECDASRWLTACPCFMTQIGARDLGPFSALTTTSSPLWSTQQQGRQHKGASLQVITCHNIDMTLLNLDRDAQANHLIRTSQRVKATWQSLCEFHATYPSIPLNWTIG